VEAPQRLAKLVLLDDADPQANLSWINLDPS
jgi:hypothetical protein